VELARSDLFDPDQHNHFLSALPFRKWNRAERQLAPPLVVELEAEDLLPAGLGEFLDGNVKRVLSRLIALPVPPKRGLKCLWALSDRLVDPLHARDFNQALMDLGATLCTPKAPECPRCPWQTHCQANLLNLQSEIPMREASSPLPHKFIGGPGTPGVLVAKKRLFRNRVPAQPGGGTVAYVNTDEHRYLQDPEVREEGGTPAIIESIRAGLVFQLKEAVGVEAIKEKEHCFVERAIESWEKNPNLQILGNRDAWRLSIVSFVVRHGDGYLHHNFVASLLNDLLGLQARAGCSCAGPYGHRLLGIDIETSREFEREIVRGCEGVKPGWVRVNFNYFLSERVFDFIVQGVHLVAQAGWRLLPDYRFEPATGLWHHRDGHPEPPLRLSDLSYESGRLEYRASHAREPERVLESYLDQARAILLRDADVLADRHIEDPPLTADFEHLRWFPLPGEALAQLRGDAVSAPQPLLHVNT